MSFRTALTTAVKDATTDDHCALILSGGVDSISVGLAAHDLGKKLHAYSFHLEGESSYDHQKAQEVAHAMGWSLTTVLVPTKDLKQDVLKLRGMGCEKKTHYEVLFPFLYVFPAIKETHILSGWCADGYYGVSNTAQHKKKWNCRESKQNLDAFRDDYFLERNRGGFYLHQNAADRYGKILHAPYLHSAVRDYLYQYDWHELNKPRQKHHVRDAFGEMDDWKIQNHKSLQTVAGVPKHFERLLDDEELNPKRYKRVLDWLRYWR